MTATTEQAVDPAALLRAAARLRTSASALDAGRLAAGGQLASRAPACGALSGSLAEIARLVDAALVRLRDDHAHLERALALLAGQYADIDRAALARAASGGPRRDAG